MSPELRSPGAGRDLDAPVLPALDRLDAIPGVGPKTAQVITAEIGLDMAMFPTAGHLVSWAKLTPRTIQSGAKTRASKSGKGNPYLKGMLGEAAAAAGKTDTFLGERYRRIARRRGKLKALVAVARSILHIIWHRSPSPPPATPNSVPTGTPGAPAASARPANIRQLQALGYTVTLAPAA